MKVWFSAVLMWAAGVACAAPLSVAQLVDLTGVQAARVSPDGKRLAAIFHVNGRQQLLVADVATMTFKIILDSERVRSGDFTWLRRPLDVFWAGSDLLAVNYNDGAESITLDGKRVADLGESVLRRLAEDDAESTMILSSNGGAHYLRVDARTGKRDLFNFPMDGDPVEVAFDKSGTLRAVTVVQADYWNKSSGASNWYRPSPKADWIKLADFKVDEERWTPMFVPDQANTLMVSSRLDRDTYAVFAYNTIKRSVGGMMAGHPKLDIVEVRGTSKDAFVRVETSGMMPQQIWFDPAWASIQRGVDAVLPGRINRLSGNPLKQVVVRSYSDVDPGNWYLLDARKMTLRGIGRQLKAIDPAQMRPMATIQYKANDGLTIPAFLTLPEGPEKNLPMVVLIHGGPAIRDEWTWDADVQLLASRGYAVFQPQFRGSAGFGKAFEQAGYRQWGLAMQDDITAGVADLIKRGVADPKRVCIFGAAYGGYAAMWGLAKTPDLYKCGISFGGVSDLGMVFDGDPENARNMAARALLRARIGDGGVGGQQFDLVSPLKHADQIKAPVLLMHGSDDPQISIAHSRAMKEALLAQGKDVKMTTFLDSGFGIGTKKDLETYYNTILVFLDKHIGATK